MFTRRTLFKLLAAVGAGSVWPTQVRCGVRSPADGLGGFAGPGQV